MWKRGNHSPQGVWGMQSLHVVAIVYAVSTHRQIDKRATVTRNQKANPNPKPHVNVSSKRA